MKYRVAFEKRSRSDGQQSEIDTTLQLDRELPESVVAGKAFVEWQESDAKHNQEVLDEDDAFLGLASAEVWEYDVFEGREKEFEDAILRSQVVMEYTVIDDAPTLPEDASTVALEEATPIPAGMGDATESDAPAATGKDSELEGADDIKRARQPGPA